MGDYIVDTLDVLLKLIRTFTLSDLLDIAVVSFLIYSFVKLVRETRAEQLVKGILILVLAYALSWQLNLKMMSSLLKNFFSWSVMALLIVFQPELRRALEQIGRSKLGKYWSIVSPVKDSESFDKNLKRCINAVVEAAVQLQKTKTGALMVFERQTRLGDIIDTGTLVNAIPSAPIIGNIFFNKAPLHDGAMIIRDGMVYAAGCILPLTKNDSLSIDLGTRHRAAVGMSENSDALIVVVSEETGTISIAANGVITRNYTRETLKSALENAILPETTDTGERRQIIPSLRRVKKNEDK